MGLNVNYNLLIEGNNVYHKIPEYKKTYNPVMLTEEFMLQKLSEFNQEMRESRDLLSSICSDDPTIVYEGTVFINLANRVREIWRKIKEAVSRVWGWIKKTFEKLIASIKEKLSKDALEEKYKYHERINLLKKALQDADKEDKIVHISDINPSKDLMDKNFPDVSVIGGSLAKMATDTMNNYCINIVQKDGTDLLDDTEVKASESFVNYIEGEKDGMLAKIFGKYSYDPTNIIQSSKDAAVKAFGSLDSKDTELSIDLYALACDNLEKEQMNTAAHVIDAIYSSVTKNFNKIDRDIDSIDDSIVYLDKITANDYSLDMKEKYHTAVKTIVSRISRASNVIQTVINANYNILFNKAIRVQQIFGFGGDSHKVKKACHRLIAKYIHIEDQEVKSKAIKNEAFIGRDYTDEIYDIQNDYNTTLIMVNEALLESAYTDQLLIAINEDTQPQQQESQPAAQDNPASAPAQPQQQQGNNNATNQNANNKSKFSVIEWVKTIIGKFGETLKRFSNRIQEFIAKNGPDSTFWAKNGEKIKKLNLGDTKANEWYKYNIDSFKNSTYVKFDIDSPALKDDASMQEAIMKKISTTLPNFSDKDTFAQKINKIYQGEYVNDTNGQGQTLQQTGYNHELACKYVEEFITRGFGSDFLGGVNNDYSKIDGDFKEVSRNYQNYAAQMKTSNADNTPDQPAGGQQTNQTAQTQQNTQAQNNSAIDEDDFRFNLAEHFGLVQREASFTVGQATSQSVDAVVGNDNQTTVQNKELDAMIKRCFNYNTIAVTAKMTAIVAAYKQYMQLFKYIIKPGSNNTNNNQNQQQQNAGENNNQQQNQDQQQQGQQQNQK